MLGKVTRRWLRILGPVIVADFSLFSRHQESEGQLLNCWTSTFMSSSSTSRWRQFLQSWRLSGWWASCCAKTLRIPTSRFLLPGFPTVFSLSFSRSPSPPGFHQSIFSGVKVGSQRRVWLFWYFDSWIVVAELVLCLMEHWELLLPEHWELLLPS